jgi:hypothetical protein
MVIDGKVVFSATCYKRQVSLYILNKKPALIWSRFFYVGKLCYNEQGFAMLGNLKNVRPEPLPN